VTGSLLRVWAALAPSIAVGAVAAVGGAVAEGLAHAPGVSAGLVGGGDGLALVVPATALVVALVRGGWQGWRPVLVDRRRGPEVLAGLAYAAIAVGAVLGAGYLAARLGARTTKLPWLAHLFAASGAAGAMALALAAARPAVRGGRWLASRVWPGVTPSLALGAGAVASAMVAVVVWSAARPLLARYDLGIAAYAGGFAAGVVAAVLATRRWRRAALWIAGAGVVVAVLAQGAVQKAVDRDPPVLLEAWSHLPVSGQLIEWRRDVIDLRAAVLAAEPAPLARTGEHPDVLLITIDSLRADRVGPTTTPALAALAAGGATFTRAYSPSTVTRGSVPAIMTSRSPGRIRGRLVDFATKLDPRHVLLAERFGRAGYATRGFLCCAHHFAGAFDVGLVRGLDQVVYDTDGAHLAQAAINFFADPGLAGGPRFGWLHTYEPHMWSSAYPAAIYGDGPGPRYDRSVAAADRALAPLIAALQARGRPTIIVVTADHGEGLGEHGVVHHAGVPYVDQIHVPLLVAAPGVAPQRIATTVGLVGLGDTLLELAGFTPPPSDGPSFAGLLFGAPAGPGEAYAAVLHDRHIPFTARSLVRGDHHLIEVDGESPRLYDLAADPGELVDLAAREPALLAALQRRLAEHRARDSAPPF
jgi:hypothetical protein